jgi:chemotaxis signal transduction protein
MHGAALSSRRRFDWNQIHADLDRRLSQLGSTYERDPARVQSLLRERSARLALDPAERSATRSQARLLVLRAGAERYGLGLESAQEICRMSRMALMPGSAAPVLGIINWRGEFVTVFDAARLLGLKSDDDAVNLYAVVLRGSEPCVALSAGGLEGIVRLDLADFHAADRLKEHDLFKGLTRDAVPVIEHGRLLARMKAQLRAA